MKSIVMHDDIATAIDVVLDYHQRTKHHLNRYARALGYMDWENQPNPFRHYHSTSIIPLEHGDDALGPLYRELFEGHIPPERVDFASISQLFYYSMALSAWKQIPGGQAWSLRVNPSSGNLHPTESYLIIGQQCSSHIPSGLYHYLPYQHALEKRRAFDSVLWNLIEKQIPKDGFLVGLSSIYWRETWKYGERGFRYCHHDVGHAIGAFTIAAISLGWHVEIVDTITDDDASVFLGCDHQQGIEAEHVDCLIIVYPESKSSKPKRTRLCLDKDFMISLKNIPCIGKENRLSNLHHDWPIIEKVSSACRKKEGVDFCDQVKGVSRENSQSFFSKSEKTAFQIIRQRRSAVSMDGASNLLKSDFYGMLLRLQPDRYSEPFDCLPWAPKISLFLFVHRINQLDQGLYVLVRDESHHDLLKSTIKSDFLWQKPDDCPSDLNLYLLAPQDVTQVAKTVSCGQDIAADGMFSLGMLVHFEDVIRANGAHFYPRLFWEAGLIGQLLYLEADAAGVQGTGIGCFFDDVMHDLLGITDQTWQSLYHFTVGGPQEDARLQTKSAYHHLESR